VERTAEDGDDWIQTERSAVGERPRIQEKINVVFTKTAAHS
jgi:hypothetical protein